MIRINLIKKERESLRRFFPTLSKVPIEKLKSANTLLIIPPMVFGAVLIYEVLYFIKLQAMINALSKELSQINREVKSLEPKIKDLKTERKKLLKKINQVKTRIKYIDKYKTIFAMESRKGIKFVDSIQYIYTNIPRGVKLLELSQSNEMGIINVKLKAEAHSKKNIKKFVSLLNRRYTFPLTAKRDKKIGRKREEIFYNIEYKLTPLGSAKYIMTVSLSREDKLESE